MSLQEFLAQIKVPEEYLEFGKEITLSRTEVVPVSADFYWSGFDDFFFLESFMGLHKNMEVIKGDGGVGSVVEVDLMDERVQKEVVKKDDATKTWVVAFLGSSSLFTSYSATIKVDEDKSETANVTLTLRGIIALKDDNRRRAHIAYLMYMLRNRINKVMAVIADKRDDEVRIELDVDCSFKKLWGAVGAWGNISWFMDATGVEVLPDYQNNDLRMKITYGTDVSEYRLVETIDDDDDPAILQYETVIPGVLYYRGKVELFKIDENKTKLKFTCYFLPKPGSNPHADIKAQTEQWMKWIQSTFAEN
ncbi:uncharacterized protein LOC144865060 [Branchiostoma floridae x Branchiostoma japonicum]